MEPGVLDDLSKLDRFFARAVMGWTIYRPTGRYTDWWCDLHGPVHDGFAFRHVRVDDWTPTKRIEQAFEVIERVLAAHAPRFELTFLRRVTPGAILKRIGQSDLHAVAPSLHLAALFVIAQTLGYDEHAPEPEPEDP